MRLGVDTGGTFTDFVLVDRDRLTLLKIPSTPDNPARAFIEGVRRLNAEAADIVHGSTVATNALLERKGARIAFVASAGFGDLLEIGRQTRPKLYDLFPSRPAPLVPPQLRFEVPERVDYQGEVLEALTPEAVETLVERIRASEVESVAVCLLFSFLNPEHEQVIGRRLAAEEGIIHVSLSSEVLPEYREYERASTTAVNAYVSPLLDRYLAGLEAGLGRPIRMMQSNGGSVSSSALRKLGVRTILSGPAGGVTGAFHLAQLAGFDQIITLDMGGTSTDVCLCPGYLPFTVEAELAGCALRVPMVDIQTVGAGGGSIARLDPGGALLVGPESAGAVPGPACYGLGGTEPTVTDANLVLGRIHPDYFVGGEVRIYPELAFKAISELARKLGISEAAAAKGIIRVANSNMARAIRRVSVERGYDPRRFTLVAFGGAGPLHACELAAELAIPRVLVPPYPGVVSAFGLLVGDITKDYSRTWLRPSAQVTDADLAAEFEPLRERAVAEMAGEGFEADRVKLQLMLDMRYIGQSYELTVPYEPGRFTASLEAFHVQHKLRYGHSHPELPTEVVNLRLRAVGQVEPPPLPPVVPGGPDPSSAVIGEQVFDGERQLTGKLYLRSRLLAGNRLTGPALVLQADSTVFIPHGWTGLVDQWGNLVLTAG